MWTAPWLAAVATHDESVFAQGVAAVAAHGALVASWAAAYLNDGVEPKRYPNGAHSFYVPAQLFPTADGYLALFITHDGFWKSFAGEAGIEGFPTMAERSAHRDEVLALVTEHALGDLDDAWRITTAAARSTTRRRSTPVTPASRRPARRSS